MEETQAQEEEPGEAMMELAPLPGIRGRRGPFKKMELRMAQAFNEGSDARLRGEPQGAPSDMILDYMRCYYRLGWDSVDREWGRDAKWEVRKLPVVGKGKIYG